MKEKDIVLDKLKEKGYKLTSQRLAIIDVLLEHGNHFMSAEDIHIKVKIKHPKTNFSTIYRNLEMLEKSGLIHKTNTTENMSLYEISCNEDHHHHIICKECGKTEVINLCPINELSHKLNNKNFTLTDHKFELYGYCDKCKR